MEGDLLRLWSDTLAWQARQKSEDEVCLLKPLYDVKSYTAEQVDIQLSSFFILGTIERTQSKLPTYYCTECNLFLLVLG